MWPPWGCQTPKAPAPQWALRNHGCRNLRHRGPSVLRARRPPASWPAAPASLSLLHRLDPAGVRGQEAASAAPSPRPASPRGTEPGERVRSASAQEREDPQHSSAPAHPHLPLSLKKCPARMKGPQSGHLPNCTRKHETLGAPLRGVRGKGGITSPHKSSHASFSGSCAELSQGRHKGAQERAAAHSAASAPCPAHSPLEGALCC